MSRRAFLPFAFAVATLASAEPAASPGKSSGALYDSGDKPGAKASPASSGAYELRGFFGAGENLEVSVRRAGTQQSQWLRVGQKSGDLLIEKADPKAGTATLVAGGRRMSLRLAAEAPPEPLKSVPVAVVEEKKLSKAEAKAERRAFFKALEKNITEEQNRIIGQVMEAKLEEIKKTNPEFAEDLKGDRPPANAEARKKITALMVPVIHEAAETAFKLPGKDGKITPLPANFRSMLTEELNEAHGEPDAPPAETNAVK